MPSLPAIRHVKICATTGARCGSMISRDFGAALGGLDRYRVADFLGQVAVRRGADVPPGEGMLAQSLPGLFLDLEPVPLGDALLHPADQQRGGVHAADVDRLVRGEQRDPGLG